MEDTYVNTRQPARRNFNNWAWLLALPLFFFLGWVANDTISQSEMYQAEPGVGGAPYIEEPGESSPTTAPRPTVTDDDDSPEPSLSPTDTPLLDDSNDEDREMMN